MSNYTSSNLKYLDQQHRQALQSFGDADPIEGEIPATIRRRALDGTWGDVTVSPSTYRTTYCERLKTIDAREAVFMLGHERPEDLPEIGSKLEPDQPLVYAGVDPSSFEELLSSINLVRLGTECDLHVLFGQSIPDLLLRASLTLGSLPLATGNATSLVAPRLFGKLLGGENQTGNWIRKTINKESLNQRGSKGTGATENPYQRMLNTLDTMVSNSPGTATFYEQAVQPHELESPGQVSIVVEASRWSEAKQSLEQLQRTVRTNDHELILASDGKLTLDTDAFDVLRSLPVSPSVKNRNPHSSQSFRRQIIGETTADVLVFVDESVEIEQDHWLEDLLTPMSIHPDVGISGHSGIIQTGTEEHEKLSQIHLPGLPQPVTYVEDDCFAVREEAIKDAEAELGGPYRSRRARHRDLQWALRNNGWLVTTPAEPTALSNSTDEPETIPDTDLSTFRKKWGAPGRIVNTAAGNEFETEYQNPSDERPRTSRRTA